MNDNTWNPDSWRNYISPDTGPAGTLEPLAEDDPPSGDLCDDPRYRNNDTPTYGRPYGGGLD